MDIEEKNNDTDLLCRFEQLPKQDIRPTFMDICRYPYNRFEEVCSRILQFYLNPFAEHGLHDLWLLALWQPCLSASANHRRKQRRGDS